MTPGGRQVNLVQGGYEQRVGVNALLNDVFVLTTNPASMTPLLRNHLSYTPPGVGGLRNDSFIVAYFDGPTSSLVAARLCLPP